MGLKAALAILNLGSGGVIPILTGIAALGVVVFLHELGHFIVAKLCGIRVEVFSLGFPPKIWGIKRGDTEYRISLIFVGGYVKLAGMEFEEGMDPRSVKDGYYASPIRTRLAVCAFGPAMNILSAFLIYCYLAVAGFPVPANVESTVVGGIEEGSAAERAGLEPGDRILSIGGREMRRWEDVTKSIVLSTSPEIDISCERKGERFSKKIKPEIDEKLKLKRIGIFPPDIVSVEVIGGSIAAAAGIKSGDFIVGVNGGKVYSWEGLTKLIRSSQGRELSLDLLRNGTSIAVTVVPRMNEEFGFPMIGIKPRLDVPMEELEANGLVAYVYRNPFAWIAGNVKEMYLTFKGLVLRAISPRGLAGPIGIVQIMSYSMRAGLRQFLYVMAFISVNLAVVNLLPVPVLDGGHILLGLIEGLKRKPLSAQAMATVQNVFVAILIALMALIFANDLMRIGGESVARLMGGAVEATPTPSRGP